VPEQQLHELMALLAGLGKPAPYGPGIAPFRPMQPPPPSPLSGLGMGLNMEGYGVPSTRNVPYMDATVNYRKEF
jgi:hypothetical protein